MIEASPALDGGVDHVDSVRHRDDQYLVLHGLRDAPQELSHLFDAVMAGASGFVLKQILGSDLVTAVRTVGSGHSLLDSRATTALMNRLREEQQQSDGVAELTDQERAVFDLIGEGLTNREIAERLFLAEKTVKNYVTRLLAKLGMRRRTQVAVLATEMRARRAR